MWCLKLKCKKLTQDISNQINSLDDQIIAKEKALQDGKINKNLYEHHHDHKRRLQSNFLVKRSLSDPQAQPANLNLREDLKRGWSVGDNIELNDTVKGENQENKESDESKQINEELNKCYDEIDQIYDYVRGFAPLPDKIKSDFENPNSNGDKNRNQPLKNLSSLQNRRMSYPTAIKDIIPPKINSNFEKKRENRNFHKHCFYDKMINENKFSYFPTVIIPFRTNSTGKIYFQSPTAQNNCEVKNGLKLFIKSSSGQKGTSKNNKLFKYAKNSVHQNNVKNNGMILSYGNRAKDLPKHNSYRSNRSLTTSPIFNIRYKSLTNLKTQPNLDYNNTLESSKSGHTSSGSNGSKEVLRDPRLRVTKVSRSLNNLFWDMKTAFIPYDNDKINNELNKKKNSHSYNLDIFNDIEHNIKDQTIKPRVGTLYL